MDKTSTDQSVEELLLAEPEEQYGDQYRSHYFTQYRDFVGSADTISARRHTANTFFLGINTALVGGSGYFKMTDPVLIGVLAGFGVMICLAWFGVIQSYKTLNSAKFDVIQTMEKHLPLAPYTAEELSYQNASQVHVPFSKWESWVPRVYIVAHLAIGAINLWRMQW
jgi:hypothetical protein